jgi:hypothetical protein
VDRRANFVPDGARNSFAVPHSVDIAPLSPELVAAAMSNPRDVSSRCRNRYVERYVSCCSPTSPRWLVLNGPLLAGPKISSAQNRPCALISEKMTRTGRRFRGIPTGLCEGHQSPRGLCRRFRDARSSNVPDLCGKPSIPNAQRKLHVGASNGS